MDRTILHCDCNGFYASVELLFRPDLREVPMAVCGNPKNRHGIILAKNELAKKYGIKTAETVWQAKQKCPDLHLVLPHHDEYSRCSRRINAIYQEYTDRVEPFSIDESWLDVTHSRLLFGDGKTIADTLRRRIREELGLTISVGVSFNKFFAKMGSDYKKPDATTVMSRGNYRELLYPLPISEMIFVGKATQGILDKFGIHTIGELAECDLKFMERQMGKTGVMLWNYANGIDESVVRLASEEREVKSVGHGITFRRNLMGLDDIRIGTLELADEVAARLRRYDLKCQTVQVQIKSVDLSVIQRQRGVGHPTNIAREIYDLAIAIIRDSWNMSSPIRMLTVTGTNLTNQDFGEQLSLIASPDSETDREKKEKLEVALDKVRDRYGHDSLSYGSLVGAELLQEDESEKIE